MNTWKLIVHGIVQGVCYRASVTKFVESFPKEIVGYAKNLPNGDVEVLATGDDESLLELEKFCWQGSELAKVENVKTTKDQDNSNHLTGFKIY
jgi:acylphosphatase